MLVAMTRYGDIASRMNEPWNCQAYTPTAMHVDDGIYMELAELARIECECTDRESVRINVECERGTTLYALELDAELYFKTYKEIWGNSTYLTAIVPTWCKLHTYDDEGTEILNDFATKKFNQLFKAIY